MDNIIIIKIMTLIPIFLTGRVYRKLILPGSFPSRVYTKKGILLLEEFSYAHLLVSRTATTPTKYKLYSYNVGTYSRLSKLLYIISI